MFKKKQSLAEKIVDALATMFLHPAEKQGMSGKKKALLVGLVAAGFAIAAGGYITQESDAR